MDPHMEKHFYEVENRFHPENDFTVEKRNNHTFQTSNPT